MSKIPGNTRKNLSVAITNTRGGVGKSTTAFVLSCLLRKRGLKVLAIDMDPQGTLTFLSLNGQNSAEIKSGVSGVLLSDSLNLNDSIIKTNNDFDIIPADRALANAQFQLTTIPGGETLLRKKVFNNPQCNYDVIIVDVPGTTGRLFQIATISTDKSLIIFEPDRTNEFPIRNTLNDIRRGKLNVYSNVLRTEEMFLGGLPSKYNPQTIVGKEGLTYLSEKLESIPVKVYSPVHERVAFKNIVGTFNLSSFNKTNLDLLLPYMEIIKDIEKIIHNS